MEGKERNTLRGYKALHPYQSGTKKSNKETENKKKTYQVRNINRSVCNTVMFSLKNGRFYRNMIIILKAKAGNFIRDNNKEGVAGNIEIMK